MIYSSILLGYNTLTGHQHSYHTFFLQLVALKQENKYLVDKLKHSKIDAPLDACNNGLNNRNEDQASNNDSSNDSCAKSSDEEGIDHFNKTFQAGTFFVSPISFTS